MKYVNGKEMPELASESSDQGLRSKVLYCTRRSFCICPLWIKRIRQMETTI